eukprot:scaffold3321_cov25-Cyclotella_meneghiniana.AAC.1
MDSQFPEPWILGAANSSTTYNKSKNVEAIFSFNKQLLLLEPFVDCNGVLFALGGGGDWRADGDTVLLHHSILVIRLFSLNLSFALTFQSKPTTTIIMSYKAGIVKAISELKDRTGSSSIAIKKHMQANLPADKKWMNAAFLKALKDGVEAGDFVKVKASYKLSAAFKEKSKPKKKAAPKKTAPKKKTV